MSKNINNFNLFQAIKTIENLMPDITIQNWVPFTFGIDEEGREMLSCPLPDDEEEILVSDGRFIWIDTFMGDSEGIHYLDSNTDFEGAAWMPLPKPYRREE